MTVRAAHARSGKAMPRMRDRFFGPAFSRNLKNTYGITLHQFLTLLRLQNHKCLGCENTLKETSTRPVKGGKRVPDESVVDHNHETGEVRGILCHNCNVAVGHMQDDWKIADRLSEYLKD